MPRRVRNDLSYFTLDCDIFSANSTLKPLIDRYAGDGLGLYIHILCDVYSKGYYYKPKHYEDYLYSLSKELRMSVEKVKLIIAFMADRSLLDANCLNKNTVITSHGIQERYAEAMKGRKRSVAEIKGEYWLLSESEEQEIDTFYKTHSHANKSEKIDDNSEKIDDKSEIYPTTEQNRTKSNLYNNLPPLTPPFETEDEEDGEEKSFYYDLVLEAIDKLSDSIREWIGGKLRGIAEWVKSQKAIKVGEIKVSPQDYLKQLNVLVRNENALTAVFEKALQPSVKNYKQYLLTVLYNDALFI